MGGRDTLISRIEVRHTVVRPAESLSSIYRAVRLKIVNKQLKIVNKLKKSTASQTHFGFTNTGLKVHRFSSTAIYFWQFLIGTPCTMNCVCSCYIRNIKKLHFFCLFLLGKTMMVMVNSMINISDIPIFVVSMRFVS